MNIDDLIREHADRLKSAHSERVPPGFGKRGQRRGWVVALGAAVAVLVVIAPVALLVRSNSGVVPVLEPPATVAATPAPGTSLVPESSPLLVTSLVPESSPAPGTSLPAPLGPGPPPANPSFRCSGGGGEIVTGDRGVSYASATEAVSAASALMDVADVDFAQESTSDIWVAGSSDDPQGIIALSQPDGSDRWFIEAVIMCPTGGTRDPVVRGESDEFTSLPYRLLVEDAEVGDIYVTGLAASVSEFFELWSELGLVGPLPEVDFQRSVVFYFGAVESGSCPLGGVEALVYNAGDQKIYPEIPIVIPSGADGCDEDASRHAVLVAVERAELPEGGFSLWINAGDPPGCCVDGVTFVAAGQLTAPPAAAFPPLRADGQLAVGESRIVYGLSTHCGVEWLLRSINGQVWRATDLDLTDASGIDPVPSAWGQSGGQIDVVVTLRDDTTLEVTGLGTDVTVTYTPDPEFPICG